MSRQRQDSNVNPQKFPVILNTVTESMMSCMWGSPFWCDEGGIGEADFLN